ncbi:MAG TPA: response regulator transcription factor [Pyrinomonadaceae bacterium]|jgi:two-component system response regulator DegU|nr:response regulator transcription factor [Pyrinomonadaceae bacterium]
MNILIVENSPRMRRTIRSLLAGLPHEVFECADGSEALAAYRTHRPDWVLMDIGLKESDGVVVTAMLKAAHPEAKVVIVTDYDDALLRQAAQHAGACAYVLKEELFELRVIIKATPETEAIEQVGSGTTHNLQGVKS